MKKSLNIALVTIILFFACAPVLQGQQEEQLLNPGEFGYQKLQQGQDYLSVLVEFRELEHQYATSKWEKPFYELMGILNSYVGNYGEAIRFFDKRTGPNYYPPDFQSSLTKYKALSAIEVIQFIVDSHQVIFINEAHHVPMHRAFSIQLLKILYDNGFRYFAAETLNSLDSELNNRKYPLLQITGFYTDEPLYADLVRTALGLGFQVVAYEHTVPCNPKEDDNIDCQNQRERGQAQNLYDRILVEDPSAKIFVHAGYGHIDEKGNDNWIPMAKYFKEITGIDPFTIDQQTMIEHSSRDMSKVNTATP